MRFNNTLLEDQFVQAAREHFANVLHSCIANCRQRDAEELTGPDHFFVNEKQEYITWKLSIVDNIMTTQSPSFTILQYAHYLQTGTMIALLP